MPGGEGAAQTSVRPIPGGDAIGVVVDDFGSVGLQELKLAIDEAQPTPWVQTFGSR